MINKKQIRLRVSSHYPGDDNDCHLTTIQKEELQKEISSHKVHYETLGNMRYSVTEPCDDPNCTQYECLMSKKEDNIK